MYRGFEFWVYDVCLSIVLAEMVDVAEDRGSWPASLLSELRIHATVADLQLPLGVACQPSGSRKVGIVSACRSSPPGRHRLREVQ